MVTLDLQDPTFDAVKAGRIEFLEPNSGAGTTNCASCHIDARKDGIAWNLSRTILDDPMGDLDPDFRDRKGVKLTQDLRSLAGIAPYHWRGEQKDLEDFDPAFENLLKGTRLEDDFTPLKEFLLSLHYPPNPFQQMNREPTDSADKVVHEFTGSTCGRCHTLPAGTNADFSEVMRGDEGGTNNVKTGMFLAMWTRLGDLADSASGSDVENIRVSGYGILSEGVVDGPEQFADLFLGGQSVTERSDFMMELDTGLAPATAFSELLDATTANTDRARSIDDYLRQQAKMGNCDLCARGHLQTTAGWQAVGLIYDPVNDVFEADDSSLGTFTFAQLETSAAAGNASLLFLGAPLGSGQRIGVDRDRDGSYDADELAAGTSPSNPDTDGDGLWDSYDPDPLGTGHAIPQDPPVVTRFEFVYANANSIKVFYETDLFSLTHIEFREFGSGGPWFSSGEDLSLPATTNHWKRRHEAFLRPQPDQGLLYLKSETQYEIRVVTKGQNGVQAIYSQNPEATINNFLTDSFRAEEITLVRNYLQGNGDWLIVVDVSFGVTQGTPQMDGQEVPCEFTTYDATGNPSTVYTKATIQAGVARFVFTPSSNDVVLGDRAVFFLPMWGRMTSDQSIVSFPGGQWPESFHTIEFNVGG